MFHVGDDFDFEDDLFDTPPAVDKCNVSAETISFSRPNIINAEQNRRNENEEEFLDIWKERNENKCHSVSKMSFPVTAKSDLTTRHIKTVRQRKFPGPAGLLPERQGNTSLVATEEFLDEINSENDHDHESTNFREKEVLSQTSGRLFESGAWSAMMDDLGTCGKGLISLMNLSSLRLKHTRGYKVPFLAVIINNIDCTLPDPTLIVKDITDEMHGMLHRDVWEKYNAEMTPGSALVLKNVGVISAGTTSRRHVLNITMNNLIAIYSNRQEEQVQVRKISDLPSGDNSMMLNEWNRIISTPPSLERNSTAKIPVNRPSSLSEQNRNMFNSTKSFESPTTSAKQSLTKNLCFNNTSTPLQRQSFTAQTFKKRKISLPNKTINQNSLPFKSNPFQVNGDVSIVDSLLDGIDTNSLFEEF